MCKKNFAAAKAETSRANVERPKKRPSFCTNYLHTGLPYVLSCAFYGETIRIVFGRGGYFVHFLAFLQRRGRSERAPAQESIPASCPSQTLLYFCGSESNARAHP